MFNPLTLAEAHQQAVTIEAQTKTGSLSWTSSRLVRTTPLPTAPVASDDTSSAKTETSIVPLDTRQTHPSSLRCFSCGEIGHRQANCPTQNRRGLLLDTACNDVEVVYDEEIPDVVDDTEVLTADTGTALMLHRVCLAPHSVNENPQRKNLFHSKCTIGGKVCKFIIDSGSSENVVAEDVVNKLSLPTELHPHPYKLAWLDKKTDLLITRRALISFSVGDSYKDQIHCDVAPMDACHMLLGRPWIFDRRIQHDGYLNTYSFRFQNRNFTLQPSLPEKLSLPSSPALILQRRPFEATLREEGFVFILLAAEPPTTLPSVPSAFTALLDEFQDVFPDDLPS